jgi:hypothetical protein
VIPVRTLTPAYLARRGALSRLVWPSGQPVTMPTAVINSGHGYATAGDPNVLQVDTLTCPFRGPFDVASNTASVDVVHPRAPLNRAVVLHGGHDQLYWQDLDGGNIQAMCAALVAAGFHVIGLEMPVMGYNPDLVCNGYGIGVHDDFRTYEASVGPLAVPALRWFVEPVVQAINYCAASFSFASIDMIGMSGGGWATDFCSALDVRIRRSVNVFGSLPFDLRSLIFEPVTPTNPDAHGDYEQQSTRPWWPLLGGLEEILYVIGCFEPGRQRTQILGLHDTAFPIDAIVPQCEAYTAWVASQVPAGNAVFTIDATTTTHQFSPWAIPRIVATLTAP